MIRRPDEYAHQNDSLAIVDESNVRGGRRVVQDLQELYGLHAYQDKLKDNITIVRVNSEDKDYRLIDKTNANTANGWVVDSVSSPPEVQISTTEPTDANIKLWGKTKQSISDLDIVRQIRDNNTSRLSEIWLDSEDPYTQWEGTTWENNRCISISISGFSITVARDINKLTNLIELNLSNSNLTSIDLSNLTSLKYLYLNDNNINSLDLSGTNNILELRLEENSLVSIPSLISKNLITDYNFTRNNLTAVELDRLRGLNFNDESRLLPQNT